MNAITPTTSFSPYMNSIPTGGDGSETAANTTPQDDTRIAFGEGGGKIGGGANGSRPIMPRANPRLTPLNRITPFRPATAGGSTLTPQQFRVLQQATGGKARNVSLETNGQFIFARDEAGKKYVVGFAPGMDTLGLARDVGAGLVNSNQPDSTKIVGNFTQGEYYKLMSTINEVNNSSEIRKKQDPVIERLSEKFETEYLKRINVALKAVGNQPGPEWQKTVGEGLFGFGQGERTAKNLTRTISQKLQKIERKDRGPEGTSCILQSAATASRQNGIVTAQKNATVIPMKTVNGKQVVDPNAVAVAQVSGSQTTQMKRTAENVNGTVRNQDGTVFTIDRDKMPGDGRPGSTWTAPNAISSPVPTKRSVVFGGAASVTETIKVNPVSLENLLSGRTIVEVRSAAPGRQGQYNTETMTITPRVLDRREVNRVQRVGKTQLESSGSCVYVGSNGLSYAVPARESGAKNQRGRSGTGGIDTPVSHIIVTESKILSGYNGDNSTTTVRSTPALRGPLPRS